MPVPGIPGTEQQVSVAVGLSLTSPSAQRFAIHPAALFLYMQNLGLLPHFDAGKRGS